MTESQPKNLHTFLDAYDRAALPAPDVELPPVSELYAEERFLDALQHTPTAPKESFLTRLSQQWFLSTQRVAWAGLAVLLVFVGRTYILSPTQPHSLTRKGGPFATQRLSIEKPTLYVGCWAQQHNQFKRVGSGESCQRQQSLIFGFSLAKQGGYAYIFRQRKKNAPPALLYPFTQKQTHRRHAGKMYLIKQQKGILEYPLQDEPKQVRFLLLQTKTPLPAQTLRALKQAKTTQAFHQHPLLKTHRASSDTFTIVVSDTHK